MISKGCLYHLVRVRDMDFESPNLDSDPIVFEKFFSNNLPGIPLKRVINFVVNLLPDTKHISIYPYIFIWKNIRN